MAGLDHYCIPMAELDIKGHYYISWWDQKSETSIISHGGAKNHSRAKLNLMSKDFMI